MKNYFPKKERECHCGCGTDNPSPVLMERLNLARQIMGEPITINSMCRCPEHNDNIGGSPTSSHIATETELCEAADPLCQDNDYRYRLLKALIQAGFRRILIYSTFIHVDVDMAKDQNIIAYMEDN